MPTAIANKTEQAQELIRDLLSRRQPTCVTSSFQTECMVLVHLLIQQKPDIPVLFLDTGYHFAETYKYRDEMAQRYGLNLVNLMPKITVAAQESQFGILNQTDPSRCCGIRKVEPLFLRLAGLRRLVHRPPPGPVADASQSQGSGRFQAAHRENADQG